MTRTARRDVIRNAARKLDRRAGKPVNLKQEEVVAIRRELAEGIASGRDVETVLTEVAERHGVTPRMARLKGMASAGCRPALLVFATEVRDRRTPMGAKHRRYVQGFE